MKNTEKKEHKFLKLVNTPVKRVSAFALATVIAKLQVKHFILHKSCPIYGTAF